MWFSIRFVEGLCRFNSDLACLSIRGAHDRPVRFALFDDAAFVICGQFRHHSFVANNGHDVNHRLLGAAGNHDREFRGETVFLGEFARDLANVLMINWLG